MLTVAQTVKQLNAKLKRMSSQADYATSVMINKLGVDVAEAATKAMQRNIDRPTPFTQKAFVGGGRYPFNGLKANKRKLSATVQAKPIQDKYLSYQIHGGSRPPTGKAIALPRAQKLNQYGNVPRGATRRMLADKRAYFSGRPVGHPGAPSGVWKRIGTKRKGSRGILRLMVKWHGQPVSYRGKWIWSKDCQSAVALNMKRRWREAAELTARTAR